MTRPVDPTATRAAGGGGGVRHRLAHRLPERGDAGFAALELALFTPFLIVMLLLVVGLGRAAHGRQLIDQSGAAAARAASLSRTPFHAVGDARTAAASTLAEAGMSCNHLGVDVDTSAFRPGGYVGVTVHCVVSLRRLAVAGLPGQVTLTSTSRSPLETYREFR